MIKLATVSPCFNEEEGLAQSVAKLTDHPLAELSQCILDSSNGSIINVI